MWRSTLVFLLMLSAPAPAQDFEPSVESGFFPLGWSPRGRFAFGWYGESQTISHSCTLTLIAQDIVTDTILWSFEKKWEESLEGGKADPCPGSASAAWSQVSANATKKLSTLGVVPGRADPGPRALPLKAAGDVVRVELAKADQGFTFSAVSTKHGSKVIATNQASACDEPTLQGYFLSPDGGRIAVLVKWNAFLPFCPAYQVIGCHLRSGFTKPAER